MALDKVKKHYPNWQ